MGLVGSRVSAERAHDVLQELVPDELVYSFHVNMVVHGRRVCTARRPACETCVLLKLCPWGQSFLVSGGG